MSDAGMWDYESHELEDRIKQLEAERDKLRRAHDAAVQALADTVVERDQLREALKFYAMKKYDNGERARIALSSEDSTP